jgi:hypothetical protein
METVMGEVHLIDLIMAGGAGLLWYLLKQKDSAQEEQIKLLFKKHDEDAAALEALKLKIAEHHYPKQELDTKFKSLEEATRDGFAHIGKKFDRLSDILVAHIAQEDMRK